MPPTGEVHVVLSDVGQVRVATEELADIVLELTIALEVLDVLDVTEAVMLVLLLATVINLAPRRPVILTALPKVFFA